MEYVLISFHVNEVGVEGLTQSGLNTIDRQSEFHNLMSTLSADEGFYLSTCNRTEYLFSSSKPFSFDAQTVFGNRPRVFENRQDIIEHLLEVALSKDSVVFGESQILGQFKRAYEQALEWGCCGSELSPLLNAIIREAKSIRSQIGLTQVHTSVSTVAAAKILCDFEIEKLRILFIGSGETNSILARYLIKRDNFEFIWTSRGHQRAVAAATDIGGQVLNWELVAKGMLPQVDVVCVATHAREILVDDVGLLNANPKLVCDLSVPANVSQEAAERLGIAYFGIEQMSSELSKSQSISKSLILRLETKITEATKKLEAELSLRAIKRAQYRNSSISLVANEA